MTATIKVVRMSDIGDYCVFGGNKFISLWTQDQSLDSFTQQIFYSNDQALVSQQLGQVVQQFDGFDSQVEQIEIHEDGRLFVTLQTNSRRLKVWHQTRVWQQSSVKARRFNFDELSVYETQSAAGEIKEFKLLGRKSVSAEACCILTVSRLQVQLLVESLSDPDMRFVCLKTIRLSPRLTTATVIFLSQSGSYQATPVKDYELSKLFDTHRNEELLFKQSQGRNSAAAFQPLDSFEFCVLENCGAVSVYRVRGITNSPQRNYEVEFIQQVRSALPVSFSKIVGSVMRNDGVHIVTENQYGHLHCLRMQNYQIVHSSTYFANQQSIKLAQEHPDLRLLALVHSDSVVVLASDRFSSQILAESVVDLCWMPNTNAMLILQNNGQVTLYRSAGVQDPFDRYEAQFSLQIPDTIAICLNAFTQHKHKLELQFTTVNSRGLTIHSFSNYVSAVSDYSFSLQANETCRLVASAYYANAGYVLLFTELLLPGRSGKVKQHLKLLQLGSETTEVFSQEISVLHPVAAKFENGLLIISLVQGEFNKYKYYLNFYNLEQARFIGFLRVSDALKIALLQGEAVQPMDFKLQDSSLIVVAGGSISQLVSHYGKWEACSTQPFQTFESYQLLRSQIVINGQYLMKCPQFAAKLTASQPIFHPNTLQTLFYKGYSKQICQILLDLQLHMTDHSKPVPDISKIKLQEAVVQAVKKPFNAFSDLEESGSDSEEKLPQPQVLDLFSEFNAKFDAIIETLCSEKNNLLGKEDTLQLVEFASRFRLLCKMDFYCDKLATDLLLHVYMQTEKVSEAFIKGVKIDLGLIEGVREDRKDKRDQFDMEQFIAEKMGSAGKSTVDNSQVAAWSSVQVCMALYSENQDVILDTLSQRLDFPQSLTWAMMRKLAIPLWLKSEAKLKQLIEIVAKNEYRNFENDGHQTKAEYAALWYILTGKVQVIKQLFNVEPDGKKFADFLANDFSNPKPRSIACKNAMALVSKRKNALACSFYLLGQDLVGAVQVAQERSRDPLLALLMCRLADPQHQQTKVVADLFITKGAQFNDPYLQSLGYWYQSEFVKAVNILKPASSSCTDQMFKNITKFDLLDNTVTGVVLQPDDCPILQTTTKESIDLLIRLRKVPEVKRLLNKDWSLDKKSKMGAGMFDDLMGSESEESVEEEVKEVISVTEQEILQFVAQNLLDNGESCIVQILSQEHSALDLGSKIKGALQHQLLVDVIFSPNLTADTVHQSLGDTDIDLTCKMLQQQNQFKTEMEFLLKSGVPLKQSQARIEQECQDVLSFVISSSQYCGQTLQADDRSPEGSVELRKVINKIQTVLETMTIEFWNVKPWQKNVIRVVKNNNSDSDSENIDFAEESPQKIQTSHTSQRQIAAEDLEQTLTFKCRMGLSLVTALYQMSLLVGKYSVLSDLLKELALIATIQSNSAQQSDSQLQQVVNKLRFESLLGISRLISASIDKNIAHSNNAIRRKLGKQIEHQSAYDLVTSWFQSVCSQTIVDLLAKSDKLLHTVFIAQTKAFYCQTQKYVRDSDPQILVMTLQSLQYFAVNESQEAKPFLDLRYFCKRNQKFKTFWQTYALGQQLGQLQELYLVRTNEDLLQNGIEVFKLRSEPITEFCVKGDMIALTLQSKGIREISVTSSLLFRTRTQNHELADEELSTWADCLHRFDQYQSKPVVPSQVAIKKAILTHRNITTLQNLGLHQRGSSQWDGQPESNFCAQVSGMEIPHEESQMAVAAHPSLDLYLTGSAKGLVCLWQFNQQTNRSLRQWIVEPEVSIKDATKKSAIKKIQFSVFGDRFCSLNLEGSIFLHTFDVHNDASLITIKSQKVTDFDFLDEDATVIVTTSQANKCLSVVDCLTQEAIAQSKIIANLVKVDQKRKCIYSFNSKPGVVQCHDFNLALVSTKTIHKEEATCCEWVGTKLQTLAVGFIDGVVKLIDLEGNQAWETKITVNAFTNVGGKKGAVVSLKTHRESGALYAASSLGQIKLLKI